MPTMRAAVDTENTIATNTRRAPSTNASMYLRAWNFQITISRLKATATPMISSSMGVLKGVGQVRLGVAVRDGGSQQVCLVYLLDRV